MSVINRTIFVDDVNGNLVMGDWCVVNTTLGMMIEPLPTNRFNSEGIAYDPSDETCKINEIRLVDFNQLAGQPPFADDTGTRLHSGDIITKTGF